MLLSVLLLLAALSTALLNSEVILANEVLATSTVAANPAETATSTPEPEDKPTQPAPTESGETITATPTPIVTESPGGEPTEMQIPELTPTETPTLEPSPTDKTGVFWELRLDAIPSGALAQARNLKTRLSRGGVTAEVSSQGGGYAMRIQGSQSLEELRQVLYSELGGTVDFIGGAAEVVIRMPIETSQSIRVDLESNFTTGYSWEVLKAGSQTGSQTGNMRVSRRYTHREGIGRAGIVTFTFEPGGEGDAELRLVYRQPFTADAPVTRHLDIQLSQSASRINLSNPNVAAVALSMEEGISAKLEPGEPSQLISASTVQLPASFNWRDLGAVPAVRNQGGCGSCWAFANVGAIESAMMRAGLPETNLSEQFLVSCNKDRWDCSGGWIADKYHFNTLANAQVDIGAVLESDKPYTATNGTCSLIANHPYKLSGHKSTFYPSVAAIKSAIHNYGSIFATVCAGPAFQNYRNSNTGIFTTNETSFCNGSVNHAINLVGWDDAGGYWILRNSWGTSWGEAGYMRIAYGTSNVGQHISWVTFSQSETPINSPTSTPTQIPQTPTPTRTVAPTFTSTPTSGPTTTPTNTPVPFPGSTALLSPANALISNDPTQELAWKPAAHAADYQVQLANNSTFSLNVQLHENINELKFTSPAFSDGRYFWRVRGRNANGFLGPWSATRFFTVDTIPPTIPVLSAPADGLTRVGTPRFIWKKASSAVRYQFAYNTTGVDYDLNFLSPELSGTSHKPPVMAPLTNYTWFARARDAAGNWSDWSAPYSVYIQPTVPKRVSLNLPASASYTNLINPDLMWKAVDYGIDYHLQIGTTSRFTTLLQERHGIEALGFVADPLLDGRYYWRVRARNVNGVFGAWSAARYFTVKLDF